MDIHPKKSLGQHFLHDKNMIRKILGVVQIPEHHRIIEIGPGTGALTSKLVQKYQDVHAIEIDKRVVKYLEKQFPELKVHQMDIRDVAWDQLTNCEVPVHIIGNIPYNLTSPILFSLLSVRDKLADAMLMLQKEVGERLNAETHTKEYGILSVQVQLMSTVKKLFVVPPEVFSPPPKVDSVVMHFEFDRPSLQCTDEHLKTVVRTAFNQRRKKIKNALEPVLGSYKPENFDWHRRPEEIPPEEYEMLTVQLERNGILT